MIDVRYWRLIIILTNSVELTISRELPTGPCWTWLIDQTMGVTSISWSNSFVNKIKIDVFPAKDLPWLSLIECSSSFTTLSRQILTHEKESNRSWRSPYAVQALVPTVLTHSVDFVSSSSRSHRYRCLITAGRHVMFCCSSSNFNTDAYGSILPWQLFIIWSYRSIRRIHRSRVVMRLFQLIIVCPWWKICCIFSRGN